jgi:RHS repeat-associated protein
LQHSFGNQTGRYLHGPQIDQVLAEETAGAVRWALADHQGSVRDVTGSQGTVLNHLTYDSYGQVTSETQPTVDFRFGYTGRERDEETGLNYYRARYFDPAVGTFVSADPLGFSSGDSNLYSYVSNSPTNFIDPTGTSAIGNRINSILANDMVYNTLNAADQVAAGIGNGSTFGATNRIRSAIYNGAAERNQSGLLYTAGSIAGDIATSIVFSAATAPLRVRQAWVAIDTARTVYDVGRSVNNIYQDITNECTDSAGSLGDYLTIGGALIGVGVNARGARNAADGAGDVASASGRSTHGLNGLRRNNNLSTGDILNGASRSLSNQTSRTSPRYGTNQLRTGRIAREMGRSEIGQYILDRANAHDIDLVVSNRIDVDPLDLGYSQGNTGVVFARNTQSYGRTAETLIHEGIHSLGVGGSCRAEAFARLAELNHRGVEIDQTAMRSVLTDIQSAGVYDDLPWRINGRSSYFPGLTF